jgi:transcriptional regulator with XRE-family HTH domain
MRGLILSSTLCQARIDAGLRREDVASRLGVSIETVRCWESGRWHPHRIGCLRDLAALYDVPLGQLVATATDRAVPESALGFYTWHVQAGVLEWDARVREMWGVPEGADVNYDVWRQGIHPDDLGYILRTQQRLLDPRRPRPHGAAHYLTYRVRGLTDGVERRVYTRAQLFDKPLRIIGFARDVVNPWCAPPAELAEVGSTRHHFDLRTWTGTWQDDTRFRLALGLAPGMPITYAAWSERLHRDDQEKLKAMLGRALEGVNGGAYDWHYRLLSPDGIVHAHSVGQVLFDGKEPTDLIGISRLAPPRAARP